MPYSASIGPAIRHCDTTSVPGLITAAMMKMIRTAYLVCRSRNRAVTSPSRARKIHDRRHLEDQPESEQHLHVQAERFSDGRPEFHVLGLPAEEELPRPWKCDVVREERAEREERRAENDERRRHLLFVRVQARRDEQPQLIEDEGHATESARQARRSSWSA